MANGRRLAGLLLWCPVPCAKVIFAPCRAKTPKIFAPAAAHSARPVGTAFVKFCAAWAGRAQPLF